MNQKLFLKAYTPRQRETHGWASRSSIGTRSRDAEPATQSNLYRIAILDTIDAMIKTFRHKGCNGFSRQAARLESKLRMQRNCVFS